MNKIKENIYIDSKMKTKTLSFFGRNQYADWKIFVAILFASFFIAVVFGLFMFLNCEDEIDIFSSNSNGVNGKKIKKDILTSMLSNMEGRQIKFDYLKANKPTVEDPSI